MSMQNLRVAFSLLAIVTLTQCKSGSGRFVAGELVEIDVSKKYPAKDVYVQDLATVEYIALETTKNTLMRFRSDAIIHVSDDYIIAQNYNEGDIFVFDGQGKAKYSFNHTGRGPTEYNILWDAAFYEKAKEVFVFDLSNPKIYVYAEDGEFRRTLSIPSDLQEISLSNFDEETLLVYDLSGVYYQEASDKSYASKPYLLMSKKDGSIVDSLPIHLPVRLSSMAVWQVEYEGQTMEHATGVSVTDNRSYGKNFIIADGSCDTIYKLTPKRELQPMIVRKPPMQSTEPKILIYSPLITNKFILLGACVMDYKILKDGGDIARRQIMYEFETGQANEYILRNKDITSSAELKIWEAVTPENTGVSLYDVSSLLALDEKGEIRGELKKLLSTLDEEDNPILMKIKFF